MRSREDILTQIADETVNLEQFMLLREMGLVISDPRNDEAFTLSSKGWQAFMTMLTVANMDLSIEIQTEMVKELPEASKMLMEILDSYLPAMMVHAATQKRARLNDGL